MATSAGNLIKILLPAHGPTGNRVARIHHFFLVCLISPEPDFKITNPVLINRNRNFGKSFWFLINRNRNFEKSFWFLINRNQTGWVPEFWFSLFPSVGLSRNQICFLGAKAPIGLARLMHSWTKSLKIVISFHIHSSKCQVVSNSIKWSQIMHVSLR